MVELLNPEKIRVIGARLLIKLDPAPERVGSILLPEGSLEENHCGATVVAVGTGIETTRGRRPIDDVQKGDRIQVIRMHELTSTNDRIQEKFGDGYVFIRYPDDILYAGEEAP